MIERKMGEPIQNITEETSEVQSELNMTEKVSEEISSQTKQDPPPVSRLVKVDNWGSFFLQQLHSLYLSKEDCDFTLQFHDGHRLEVHRNVLNACTEFFKNLKIEGSNVLLPIEFSFEAFNAIINFMYTGRLEYADQICENMYSIAKVLKMTVLVKLLEAQSQNQENSGGPTPIKIEKGKPSPLVLTKVGKTTKVMKKISTNGKKSIKLLSSSSSTLPGKKLPIWKKRTVPLPATSFFSANGIIKRNILDPARPVRFEWPDDSLELVTIPDEFEDLSYHSQPLLKPNRGELQYLSAEDFDSKVNSVLKRSFTSCQDDFPEKRSRIDSSIDRIYSSEDIPSEKPSRIDSSVDRIYSSEDIHSTECISNYSNSQIITSRDDDNDSSDNDNDLSEELSLPNRSNGCDLNVTSDDIKPLLPAASTPKPILKTSGTPSSSKKVRFSLEEKENAQSFEGQTVSSVESVRTGTIRQTDNPLDSKPVFAGTMSTMIDRSAKKPAPGKSYLLEKDATRVKRTVGSNLPANENVISNDKLIFSSRNNIASNNETNIEKELDILKNREPTLYAEEDVSETQIEENTGLKVPQTGKTVDTPNTTTVISDKKQVTQKPVITEAKAAVPNHARIVAEVLKKYPHLVNKNVRLKIMNQDGNKNSVTSIKINGPANQSSTKTSKNAPLITGNVAKRDSGRSVENLIKNASTKDPSKGPWQCSSCGINGKSKDFANYFSYHKHLQEVHQEKIDARICEHCGQKFSKRNLLSYHLYKKHNVPPPRNLVFPKCDQCDYIALTESLLIKHRNSIAHQSEFECKVCNAKFKSNGALQGHMQAKLHFSESSKKYQCPHCHQEFPRNTNLKAHIRNVHPKQRLVEQVSSTSNDQMYNNVLLEQQNRENERCTLILPSGVTLVADAQQVPLLPSSESEALNNVASGIATSIGLNDSLVNGETVILLNEGTEYFLQNGSNQGEYIVPEILTSSDQMYAFPQKDQLEQVTTIANLCSGVPTSVGQLISEDTIVTIDNSTNNYSTGYSVPISLAEKLQNRDNNQLILFTLSDSEPSQKLTDQNGQNIIVTQASGSLPDTPTYSGETCLPSKLADASFEGNIHFGVPNPQFRDENVETIESVQEQNTVLSHNQSQNISESGSETQISNQSIHLDPCEASSSVTDNRIEAVSVTQSAPLQEQNVEDLPEPIKPLVPAIKVDSSQMEELVQDWDEFSDEEREVEREDDGKLSNLPCRPTFGPIEAESFLL